MPVMTGSSIRLSYTNNKDRYLLAKGFNFLKPFAFCKSLKLQATRVQLFSTLCFRIFENYFKFVCFSLEAYSLKLLTSFSISRFAGIKMTSRKW